MQQRLAGLEARKQQLVAALELHGIMPIAAEAAAAAAGPGPSSQAAAAAAGQGDQPRPRAAAGPSRGAGSAGASSRKKGKQKVQFQEEQQQQLVEDDIFGDAEGQGGSGSGGAQSGLVETERDRLIRLVRPSSAACLAVYSVRLGCWDATCCRHARLPSCMRQPWQHIQVLPLRLVSVLLGCRASSRPLTAWMGSSAR